MSGIWGTVHLASAAIGSWALTLPTVHAVAVTSVLGVMCTVASVGGCITWDLWRSARIPGLRIVYGDIRAQPQTLPPADGLLAQQAA